MSLLVFFITFQIIFGMASGGIAPRFMYALRVSTGLWSFLQNYALSYQVSYDQIHSTVPFLPELNSKLEKLLAIALTDLSTVTIEQDYTLNEKLCIKKSADFSGNRYDGTVYFYLHNGKIDDEKYSLSPTVFILAQKVYDLVTEENRKMKLKKKSNKI